MKYALTFFVLSFFALINATKADASTIKSFQDSNALTTIAEFLLDSTSDLPPEFHISDKKIKLTDTSSCTDGIDASVPLKEVQSAIKTVLRRFPDEDLPVEDAINDLTDYLDHQTFKKCIIYSATKDRASVRTSYYVSANDKIQLKVDTITLLGE